jgi:alkylation response protein AidB-like acyl-CoA dehydrogenase
VDLMPTDEQTQISDMIGQFLGEKLPVDRLRSSDIRVDKALWTQMSELGFFGLSMSESLGGTGLGIPEEILLNRELGRNLITPSVLATGIATHLAAASGEEELAGSFLAGQRRAAFALCADKLPDRESRDFISIDYEPGDLLLAVTGSGPYLVDPHTPIQPQRLDSMDESIRLEAIHVGSDHTVHAPEESWSVRLRLMIAAQLAGIAAAARDLAVDYAKTRVQFGQPIGAFQAIKHKCADMAVGADVAWWQVVFAAITAENGDDDARSHVACAAYLSAMAALRNASESIQIHGAIGFTAECHAHRFLKRAHLLARIGGSPREDAETAISV